MSTKSKPAFAATWAASTKASPIPSSSPSVRSLGSAWASPSSSGLCTAMRGSGEPMGFDWRPACVSCRPTNRSSVDSPTSRYAGHNCRWSQLSLVTTVAGHNCRCWSHLLWSQLPWSQLSADITIGGHNCR